MSYAGVGQRPSGRAYFYYELARGSMGNYGKPDGDPAHEYEIREHRGNGNVTGYMSLDHALREADVPPALKDRIKKLYTSRGLTPPVPERVR